MTWPLSLAERMQDRNSPSIDSVRAWREPDMNYGSHSNHLGVVTVTLVSLLWRRQRKSHTKRPLVALRSPRCSEESKICSYRSDECRGGFLYTTLRGRCQLPYLPLSSTFSSLALVTSKGGNLRRQSSVPDTSPFPEVVFVQLKRDCTLCTTVAWIAPSGQKCNMSSKGCS